MTFKYPFYTNTIETFLTALQHFVARLPSYTGTLASATTANIIQCNNFAENLDLFLTSMTNGHAFQQTLLGYRNDLLNGDTSGPVVTCSAPTTPVLPTNYQPGQLAFLINLLAQLKADPNFNVITIGADLGMNPPAPAVPSGVGSPPVPTFSVTMTTALHVTIKHSIGGFEAVQIQSRLAGTPTWANLPLSLHSPFIDVTPLAVAGVPEIREYRFCYVTKTGPTLNWSTILTVTVTP